MSYRELFNQWLVPHPPSPNKRIDVDDLWMEIFTRLPVKSLCQCRCVCKSWNSVILSTSFITFHHNFIISHTPPHKRSYFLLDQQERPYIPPGYALYHPHLRHTEKCITPVGLPFPVPKIAQYRRLAYSVIGVIHGVVCLASVSSTVVWNPTTRKHISIENKKYDGEYLSCFFGFGFCAVKKDFKVVAHMCKARQYYDVLSVKDGCWRRKTLADNIYPAYGPISNSRFLNGTIYWIAGSLCAQGDGVIFSILSFDCESDEFKTMEFPPELRKNRHLHRPVLQLFKFCDKLSILREAESYQHPYELWVMEEGYGAANTWTKLFTINQAVGWLNLLNYDIFLGQDSSIAVASRDKQPSVDLPCRLHEPLNAHVFEESLFLMDVHSKAQAQHKDVKLYFGYRSKGSALLALFLAVSSKLMATD